MKDYIYVMIMCVIAGAAALFALFLIGYIAIDFLFNYEPDPAPTIYQTGLYVESEQVQQTIDGRELQ
jgi:hypothetical protein